MIWKDSATSPSSVFWSLKRDESSCYWRKYCCFSNIFDLHKSNSSKLFILTSTTANSVLIICFKETIFAVFFNFSSQSVKRYYKIFKTLLNGLINFMVDLEYDLSVVAFFIWKVTISFFNICIPFLFCYWCWCLLYFFLSKFSNFGGVS